MESFVPIERMLWAASLLAVAFLIFHLFSQCLVRRYPFFTAYLLAELMAGTMLIHMGVHGREYAKAFRISIFLTAVLRLGVAAELYERICQHFPGIGTFRFALASVLGLLAAAAAVTLFSPDLAAQWGFPQTTVQIIRRYQGEILAALFLLTWIFFRYALNIQQPFRPNVLNHWRIATIYFGVSGIQALAVLITGGGSAVHPINSAMLAADIGCFLAWIHLMQRSGEELPWFPRLSSSEIEAVEQYHHDLLETARSLPREISDRATEN